MKAIYVYVKKQKLSLETKNWCDVARYGTEKIKKLKNSVLKINNSLSLLFDKFSQGHNCSKSAV